MSVVVLDALAEDSLSAALKDALATGLLTRGQSVAHFDLQEQQIGPCRSCGACAFRSPGKCVIKDDIHSIMRAIVRSNLLVLLTPIRFGGYSSLLKTATDRFMPFGAPLYFKHGQHLLHPMRYKMPRLLGIGIAQADLPGEEDAFRLMVARNGLNIQAPHLTMIIHPQDSTVQIASLINQALQEVCPA